MGLQDCRVSISGIRGIVGAGLDVDLVLRLAQTFAWQHTPGPLLLARDTRNTGPMLRHAVLAGVLSRGVDVIDLGIAPTPTVGFSTARLGASGALNLTASHNPPQWNALKLYNERGLFLSQAEVDRLVAACETGDCGEQTGWEMVGRLHVPAAPLDAHVAAAAGLADADRVRSRGLRVAIDGCRGAGSIAGPELLQRIGCTVVRLDCEPDGDFTRGLEPVPEHLARLGEVVRRERCDVGFALDPDADRLALVDERGRPIGEEYTLVLAAEYVLAHAQRFAERQRVLVANLSSSRMLEDAAERHGARVVRTPVGEANVVAAILDENAVIGGEGNGGVILPAVHAGRDALTGMALLVSLLVERERPLSEIVRQWPSYRMVKTTIGLDRARLEDLYTRLAQRFEAAEADRRDGLKLSLPDRWLHVRPSNTEPIVRAIAEAPTDEDTQTLVRAVREAAG